MMDNVSNKTVMITGGAAGMGYKYAEILLRNGAKSIAIIDLPTSNGENAATTLENEFGKNRVIFIAADVANIEDLEKAFKRVIDEFKTLDILINNAGVFNEKIWERTIDINMKALIRGSYLALEHMAKYKGGKGGLIVNVSSVAGLFPWFFVAPVYTATKYAVLGFSQCMAGVYEETGVRVLVMCPGGTRTKITENVTNNFAFYVSEERAREYTTIAFQSVDNVALAMLDLIQRGINGAAWVSENGESPYAVKFSHYSDRSLPI